MNIYVNIRLGWKRTYLEKCLELEEENCLKAYRKLVNIQKKSVSIGKLIFHNWDKIIAGVDKTKDTTE